MPSAVKRPSLELLEIVVNVPLKLKSGFCGNTEVDSDLDQQCQCSVSRIKGVGVGKEAEIVCVETPEKSGSEGEQ